MNIDDFFKMVRPHVLSNKNYNKVFCIGENKTGTTTLQQILLSYGFRLPVQQEQEIHLTKQTLATNYQPFIDFVSKYDAFQDRPFSKETVYVAADALFPNSRFILTEREPEAWFNSVCNFHRKIWGIKGDMEKLKPEFIKKKMNYLYEGYIHEGIKRQLTHFDKKSKNKIERWDLVYNKDFYISQYNQRNEQIKKYFMDCPEKLLVVDITKEKTTKAVCDFLNIPSRFAYDTPHLNKT